MAKYLQDFRAGDQKKIQINYGVDKDLTGWQFRLVILSEFGKTPVLDITTTAGDYADDVPTEGLVFILVDIDDSALVPSGKYYYYIERIIPGTPNDVLTILPPVADYKDKVWVVEK